MPVSCGGAAQSPSLKMAGPPFPVDAPLALPVAKMAAAAVSGRPGVRCMAAGRALS